MHCTKRLQIYLYLQGNMRWTQASNPSVTNTLRMAAYWNKRGGITNEAGAAYSVINEYLNTCQSAKDPMSCMCSMSKGSRKSGSRIDRANMHCDSCVTAQAKPFQFCGSIRVPFTGTTPPCANPVNIKLVCCEPYRLRNNSEEN